MSEKVAIRLQNVCVKLGGQMILPDLSLTMGEGKIVSLLGPSGAGKTTLVRSIMGMCRFSGRISVFDRQMPSVGALAEIGYMAQSDALYEDLSGWDNLLFFGSLYGLQGGAARKRAEELLDFVDLTADKSKLVKDYSGGMKRRLSLAAALMHNPRLLILDEPTVGIDPLLRNKFWDEFRRLKDAGHTLLMTTHVMDEARRCDGILLLRAGRIIAEGTPAELLSDTGTTTIEDAFLVYSTRKEIIA